MTRYCKEFLSIIKIKPIPRLKKIAGPHLEKSWTEIPHVTQQDAADITEMEKFRGRNNSKNELNKSRWNDRFQF